MPRTDPEIGLLDHELLGQYRASLGIALGATQVTGGILWACRWGDSTRLAIVTRFQLRWQQTVAFTTTQENNMYAQVARGFTASDTGGASQLPTGNGNKLRTSMSTTLFTDMRAATVVAGLTAGTRTLDPNPFLTCPVVNTAANVNPQPYTNGFDASTGWQYPIVLAQNEGLEASFSGASFPAAGGGILVVEIDWSEVNGF
jgi:hypothetical protein